MTREACIKCRSIPNDILVLECDHSLCMKCASRFCSIESSTIMCPFCKSQTYLEQSIVNQICQYSVGAQEEQIRRAGFFDQRKPLEAKQVWYKMSNKENMVAENTDYPSFNKADSRFKMSRKNSLERHPEIKKLKKQAKDQIKYHQQEKGSLRPSTVYCKYHSEYEVMYLCLECQSSIICPECVIHGEHKNHQVETIKKTITKIQAELSSKIYTLGCSIEGLVGASEQKKQKLKSKIEQINKLKMQAASKYKMIRQEIAREEAEVMSKCTNLIACFQEDFSQIQKWIKNDLLAIQRQRDSINYILNPYSQKNGKKQGKVDQKLIQVKIVEQYLNHFRKNDKYKSNKYLWLNNKQISEQSQPESEQNLTVLTDRIQRIKFVPTASTSTKIDYNEMATKNHSLAASRNVNGLKQSKSGFTNDKKQSYYRYVESPFNNLKMSTDKQNNGFETESILIKASHIKDSSKMKRKSLKSEEQTNFLIF